MKQNLVLFGNDFSYYCSDVRNVTTTTFVSREMTRHLAPKPLPSGSVPSSGSTTNRRHPRHISNFAILEIGTTQAAGMHGIRQDVVSPPPQHWQRAEPASNRTRRAKREVSLSDAFSKNITMILEDLLKDYDKTERPAFRKGKAFETTLLY